MTWAAVWQLQFPSVVKVGAFLSTIPTIVMGGIMIVFGPIAVVGMSTLIKGKVDVTEPRNLCIISVVMTFGIGNMFVNVGDVVSLKGISLLCHRCHCTELDFAKSKNEVE